MKKLKTYGLLALLLLAIQSGFSQNLRPTRFEQGGKVFLGFDSVQIGALRKELELKQAFERKIKIQESEIGNLQKEVELEQKQTILLDKINTDLRTLTSNQDKEIAEYALILHKYRKSDRKAKFGKILYKTLTGVLAGCTVYLLVK